MKLPALLVSIALLIGTSSASQSDEFQAGERPWTSVLRKAGELNSWGEFRQAADMYRSVLDAESGGSVELSPSVLAYVLSQLADAQISLGHYAEAENGVRQALAVLEGAGESQSGVYAITMGVLGDILQAKGDYEKAVKVTAQAVSLGRKSLSRNSVPYGILLTKLATTHFNRKDFGPGVKLCQEAVAAFLGSGDLGRIQLGTAYENLAAAYVSAGKLRKALEKVNLAVATWASVLPPDHPYFAYALGTKADTYRQLKDFPDAEAAAKEMLKLADSHFGPNDSARVTMLNHAAAVYIAETKYDQAEPLLYNGTQLAMRLFPAGHPILATMLTNYTFVLEKLNRKEEASHVRAENNVLLAFPEQAKIPPAQLQKR